MCWPVFKQYPIYTLFFCLQMEVRVHHREDRGPAHGLSLPLVLQTPPLQRVSSRVWPRPVVRVRQPLQATQEKQRHFWAPLLHQKSISFIAYIYSFFYKKLLGSCLKTGQHSIFVIINILLPIKCIIFDSVSKILFIFLLPIIMILIMKILLLNVYKIINLRYPTYVYKFFKFSL